MRDARITGHQPFTGDGNILNQRLDARSVFLHPHCGSFKLNIILVAAIALATFLVSWLVYETGGTQYSTPYLILVPIILAGAAFKAPGGLLAALAAGLLLGPYMPIDTASGAAQTLENWLVRLALYLMIGGFTGLLASVLDASGQRLLLSVQTDPGSGLISSTTVRQLIRTGGLARQPSHVVAIGFEGHNAAIIALGSEIAHTVIGQLGRHFQNLHDGDGVATRIQGGTFCVVLPGGEEAVDALIERCDRNVPQIVEVDGVPIPILLRFGVAELTEADREGPTPFRTALLALRNAMDTGQRIAHYWREDEDVSDDELRRLAEFRDALSSGACTLHYQPKLSCATNRIYGVEALIRWRSETRGDITPGRFLPLVESTLLINDLTRFVVDSAMRASVAWRSQGVDLQVAINLSMLNLEDRSFIDFLLRAPTVHGVPASRFELELTETALMRRIGVAKEGLDRLRDAGFVISIDDYGTGASSLRYLKELSINGVKLDQSFVGDLPENELSREIAAATAAMCKGLGLTTIAEGVETAGAFDFIVQQGFDAVQGYWIARPMPEEDLIPWLSAFEADRGDGASAHPNQPLADLVSERLDGLKLEAAQREKGSPAR